jgi:hypothetical protein
MMPDLEVGQAGERRGVRSDDRPSGCHGGCGDQQIVSSTPRALAAHLDEQPRMSLSDGDVVGDHCQRTGISACRPMEIYVSNEKRYTFVWRPKLETAEARRQR